MILRSDITGLVLAGGRGTRMGGLDKGLQTFHGLALAQRALRRLAPQVGRVAINANRHLATYAAMDAPVWPDALPDQPGPLAGMLAGLTHCDTPWLVTVPCDAPLFPIDLVKRLAAALDETPGRLAVATTLHADGARQQPVFCLLNRSLAPGLRHYLASGQRQVGGWVLASGGIEVPFADTAAFANINTLAELERLHADG